MNLFRIVLIVVLVSLGYFWVRSGIRYFKKRHNSQKVRDRTAIEDALKHFYDCGYRKQKASVQSLCGSLGIKGGQAAALLAILESEHFVMSGKDGLTLTPDGQAYALRIIRAHRLWECYLAEETGFAQTEWHQWAEKLEHDMEDAEIGELAASVGNPLFDPHGDPIPSQKGEMPPLKEQPLIHLEPGDHAEIVHLEDEPEEVFAQIAACGLSPGQLLQVKEKTPRQITFSVNGESVSLLPVIAANIAVQQLESSPAVSEKFETLANLKLGECGKVVSISSLCRGMQRRRIMDLGATPGTVISVELNSVGRDPVGYGIRGAVIALRKNQAELIQIKRMET